MNNNSYVDLNDIYCADVIHVQNLLEGNEHARSFVEHGMIYQVVKTGKAKYRITSARRFDGEVLWVRDLSGIQLKYIKGNLDSPTTKTTYPEIKLNYSEDRIYIESNDGTQTYFERDKLDFLTNIGGIEC